MSTAAQLKARIKAKIEAVNNFPESGTNPVFADERIIQALAEAIWEHITIDVAVKPGTFTVDGGDNWPITGLGDLD